MIHMGASDGVLFACTIPIAPTTASMNMMAIALKPENGVNDFSVFIR
jgi:hypothetical protein